jgi:hypothetical protein
MKVLHTLMWVSGGLAVLVVLAGCTHSRRDRFPDETVYVEQPPYAEPPQYVIVREAPPPGVVERRPTPPGQGLIWIEGYWHWDGQRYVWRSGHWAVPPRGRAVWVAPRYEKHEKGFQYTPGRWREEQQQRRRDDEPRRDRR